MMTHFRSGLAHAFARMARSARVAPVALTLALALAAICSPAAQAQWSGAPPSPATSHNVPSAPQNASIATGNMTLTFSWNAPANNGGSAITDYRVRWAEGAGSDTWINTPGGVNGESSGIGDMMHSISSLTSGATYEVQVAAANTNGTGTFSASVQGVIPAVLSFSQSTLMVTEGDSGGGGTVPANTEINLSSVLSNPVSFMFVVSGDSAIVGEDFTDDSFGAFGISIPDGVRSIMSPINILGDALVEDDEILRATISKLDASDASYVIGEPATIVITIVDNDRDSAAIAFGMDAAATATYTATASEASGTLDVPVTISHAPDAATTFFIETSGGATEGGSGDYTIAAKHVVFPAKADAAARTQNIVITLNDDTQSEVDEEITLRLLPADDPVNDLGDYYTRNAAVARISVSSDDRPRAPMFTLQPGNATLTLNWTLLDGEIGVTGYRIRWRLADAGGGSPGAWNDDDGIDPGSNSAYTITNLVNISEYEVQIFAINTVGDGDWSDSMRDSPTPPPAAPGNLMVTPGAGLLTLTWTAPATGSAEAASGYAVRWAEGNDAVPSGDGLETKSRDTTYVLRGLKSATTYEVQVAARNAAGLGEWTASVEGLISTFDLDVNQSGGAADWRDGVLIARYLTGVRGEALIAGGLNNSREAADIEAHINAGELDIDDANGITAADGIMLGRYLMGVTGAALTDGQSNAMPAKVIENIEAL